MSQSDELYGLLLQTVGKLRRTRDHAARMGENSLEEDLFQIEVELIRVSSDIYDTARHRAMRGLSAAAQRAYVEREKRMPPRRYPQIPQPEE
jgi:hypothetical protein